MELQSPPIQHINLILNDVDEQGNPVTTTWKLAYEYRAIKRAEESIKVDLKSFEAWKTVSSAMTPQLVHAGLSKFHPDVTLDEVMDKLNPAVQRPVHEAIFEFLFPGILDAMKKVQETEPKNVEGGVEAAASV
jgi:hypothetical protein